MTTQTEALKLADALNELLESFEKDGRFCKSSSIRNELYHRLKQTLEESKEALAQPEQEPVAEIVECSVNGQQTVMEIEGRWKFLKYGTKLYTTPPQPKEPEQEPVAWWCDIQMQESSCQPVEAPRCMTCGKWTDTPCTEPPQRKPLTDEPTKEMIDAAERIDWSDSDVRGNIVNMWQAMCAAAHGIKREA